MNLFLYIRECFNFVLLHVVVLFTSTTYWRECLFCIVCSSLLYHKLIDHKHILGFLSCFIDLCVYICVSTIMFWLLKLSKVSACSCVNGSTFWGSFWFLHIPTCFYWILSSECLYKSSFREAKQLGCGVCMCAYLGVLAILFQGFDLMQQWELIKHTLQSWFFSHDG